MAIESDAVAWLKRSIALLATGDEVLALQAVEASLRLKREPLALLVQGFLLQPATLDADAIELSDFPVQPEVVKEQYEQLDWTELPFDEEEPETIAEEQPVQANALVTVAEVLQEEPATEGMAQAGVMIDRIVKLTKKVWFKLKQTFPRHEA
ncbi:MAG: hypothetical protein DM484_12445 [Candidatus Methylumidiphilus alinenensis]|uniref:Uncharacterized protein n=1 Tax=Candidatus Methylumidiphilus alinenensis TaxID=2202197 RepID=A0A2W4R5B1_9GAMM|nr:MAG: hypothetical protein DM484_12445 [Candidatus Methylumidiphilus alinenensis]